LPTIQIDNAEIHYEAKGHGEPVLLIAGFAGDHSAWSVIAQKLAANYQVISYDNRGTGRTEANVADLSICQMARDASALIDALELGSAHVVGYSMGGMIAQELALTKPDQVQSLALIACCAQLDARGKFIIEQWGDLPQHLDATTVTRIILPWTMTNRFFATPGAVEEFVAQILAHPHPPTLEGLKAQSRAISACDTLARLDQIACPTLVLTGREDIVFPVIAAEQLAKAIQGAKLTILERLGHGMLAEAPKDVANALKDFLGGLSTRN
jgi:3-oxoadipate enol-lactonase